MYELWTIQDLEESIEDAEEFISSIVTGRSMSADMAAIEAEHQIKIIYENNLIVIVITIKHGVAIQQEKYFRQLTIGM